MCLASSCTCTLTHAAHTVVYVLLPMAGLMGTTVLLAHCYSQHKMPLVMSMDPMRHHTCTYVPYIGV